MDRKSCFCIFFIVLLISPGLILAKTMKDLRESKNKRQAQALLPLSYYTGITVSAPVFAALVAAYGIYAVTKYAIKKATTRNDSHSCANNRGWCRRSCFNHEYIDWYHTDDVCGSFYCCRPGRRGKDTINILNCFY